MNELDRLIHEPARLSIMALLPAVKEAGFLYLLRETGLTKSNLSSHLDRLEQAAYVEIEKTFRGKDPANGGAADPAGQGCLPRPSQDDERLAPLAARGTSPQVLDFPCGAGGFACVPEPGGAFATGP
jgi:DNA-binding transcriptional ArsR family regulator